MSLFFEPPAIDQQISSTDNVPKSLFKMFCPQPVWTVSASIHYWKLHSWNQPNGAQHLKHNIIFTDRFYIQGKILYLIANSIVFRPVCFALDNQWVMRQRGLLDRAAGRSSLTVSSVQISRAEAPAAWMENRWRMMGDPCRGSSGTGYAH